MKLTVFGTGYVGLTQAVCLAEVGHSVCCVDVNAQRIALLASGESPIYEPGLSALLQKNLADGHLRFTTNARIGIDYADVIFIAVGTPPTAEGGADLTQLFCVVDSIIQHATSEKVVVNKSTSPVGTLDAISRHLAQNGRPDSPALRVVSNPEFLKEGSAVNDCMRPDRIIIGGADAETLLLMREIYQPFSRNHDKLISMDGRSAELTKYAANCMLATRISFINEIANLAEHLGADIEAVRRGIGSDPRIGYDFIYAGCGFGGSCFPKDLSALRVAAHQEGYRPRLLEAVEAVNHDQKTRLFEKISRHYHGELADKTFALWGLAFKPNTDDLREAPSHVLLQALWKAGARVRAYDPQAMGEAARLYGARPDLELVASKEEALRGADALIIVTEWQAFRVMDMAHVPQMLEDKVVFDGRNMFEPSVMADAGLIYYGMGRGQADAA